MKANIIICMDTQAFRRAPATELGKVLRDIAAETEKYGTERMTLQDSTGVQIGHFWINNKGGNL